MRRAPEPLLDVPAPDASTCARVAEWLREVDAAAARLPVARHINILVTPLGLPSVATLNEGLRMLGVQIQERRCVAGWPRLSTAAQVRGRDAVAIRRAALFEAVWSGLFPDGAAEVWSLEPSVHARVAANKRALRERVPSLRVLTSADAGMRLSLHPFHLADLEDGEAESRRLAAALELLGR